MASIRLLILFILSLCVEAQGAESKKIVIFGAGYVGLVTGSCLAHEGHQVTFIEKNPEKVAFLESRQIPISEPQLEELFCTGMEKGLIRIRGALNQELIDADFVFLAVPTPTNEAGEPQIQAVQEVISQIISTIPCLQKKIIVVIRSTILPAAFRQLESSCEAESAQISLVMHPEFLRESTAVRDFFHPPFCVAGGKDLQAVHEVLDLYAEMTPKRYALSGEAASLLKYACNAFHAAKIAFTNEISSICESLQIDPVEVMDIFAKDTHLNISTAYLKPGFAFGGSCLTKDIRALLSAQSDPLPLLASIVPSNQGRFHKGFQDIIKGNHRRLAVLGISFKKGSDDVRESPYVDLIEALHQEGIALNIYDPDIDCEKLKASNRQLYEQRFASLVPMMRPELSSALEGCDGVVLCKDYLDASALQEWILTGMPVYDLGYYGSQKSTNGK